MAITVAAHNALAGHVLHHSRLAARRAMLAAMNASRTGIPLRVDPDAINRAAVDNLASSALASALQPTTVRAAIPPRRSPPRAPARLARAWQVNRKFAPPTNRQSTPWSTAMLAEIYLLKLEAAVRAAKEAATTASTSRFVPVTLPAAKAS
jgi:hypothetical protein